MSTEYYHYKPSNITQTSHHTSSSKARNNNYTRTRHLQCSARLPPSSCPSPAQENTTTLSRTSHSRHSSDSPPRPQASRLGMARAPSGRKTKTRRARCWGKSGGRWLMGGSARGDINLLRGVMLWIWTTEELNWRREAMRGVDDYWFDRYILLFCTCLGGLLGRNGAVSTGATAAMKMYERDWYSTSRLYLVHVCIETNRTQIDVLFIVRCSACIKPPCLQNRCYHNGDAEMPSLTEGLVEYPCWNLHTSLLFLYE